MCATSVSCHVWQGYKPRNIVLLGDSAGGGMVPAMAIQLQREGQPLPAALGMFSPYAEAEIPLDTHFTLIAINPYLPGPASPSEDPLALAYTGGNRELLSDPLVSPLRADYATLFAGGKLPATLIQVGCASSYHCTTLWHSAGCHPAQCAQCQCDFDCCELRKAC